MKTRTISSLDIKYLGRTVEHSNTLWCALSATGIEFKFTGTYLDIAILGDDSATSADSLQYEKARLAIYIDDQMVIDECIRYKEKTYNIINSGKPVTSVIKVLKLSEAPMSLLGIRSITSNDTAIISSTPELPKKIEFIGDSITCGYGIEAESEAIAFNTSTENPTKAYAYLTAKKLNMDYSLVSYSGHGIISGYTEGDVPYTDELVPPFYSSVGQSRYTINDTYVTNVAWDFSKFQPDIVVINLGTNDDSYCKDHTDRQETFMVEYSKFLETVRNYNPNAYIVCVLGIMGDRLYPYVARAVDLYKERTNDMRITSFALTPQNPANGYGADWHPSPKTHQLAADELSSFLLKLNM